MGKLKGRIIGYERNKMPKIIIEISSANVKQIPLDEEVSVEWKDI